MSLFPPASFPRIVVKIGSALLVDPDGGVRRAWLEGIAGNIAARARAGQQVAVVSSGAIALGARRLRLAKGGRASLEDAQAAAATGQIELSRVWADVLAANGLVAAQMLVTLGDLEDRRRYLNAAATLDRLLGLGAIPIINENDSVATAEIRYGDNDRLSARVATMIEADLLVLLSDIDGLYTAPPAKDPAAAHIPVVERITPAIEAMAGGAASHLSRGGMTTKVEAGKIATLAGTAMIIAKGTETHPLKRLGEGGLHTLFQAATSRAQSRKRWIMGTLAVSGTVQVDAGAAGALKNGRSLLPVGVTRITGEFERGDTIAVIGPDGIEIARGLSGLDSDDARLVMGKKSHAIVELLGAGNRAEMVHRDNMVLTGSKEELAS